MSDGEDDMRASEQERMFVAGKQLCVCLIKGPNTLFIPVNGDADVESALNPLLQSVEVAVEDRDVGLEWKIALVEMTIAEIEALEEMDWWGE